MCVSLFYQSHHTGIETDHPILFPSATHSTNRTILELKHHWIEKRLSTWTTNRTILELKQTNLYNVKDSTILPIAPYWN